MKNILIVLTLLFCASTAHGQTELGDASTQSKTWTMLSLHRVWTPQNNNAPNGGFGVNAFFSVDQERTSWLGFSVMGTGLDQRDAIAINFGAGWWLLGDSSFGMFGYAMTGLGISSNNALTGFGFFTDPTTAYGLASQGGLGVAYELFTNLKLHFNSYGLWFTTDGGPTPFGAQLGLTLGGK